MTHTYVRTLSYQYHTQIYLTYVWIANWFDSLIIADV